MSYTIYKADGTAVTVADNALDNSYFNPTGGGGTSTGNGMGVQLVGRNTINYGAPVAQNFLQLTENFASTQAFFPSDATALQGQLWFNQTTSSLYVRTSASGAGGGIANWKKLVTVSDSETGTTPVVNPSGAAVVGDIKVLGSAISIYADGAWRQIFPAVYS